MNQTTPLLNLQPGTIGSIYAIKEMNPILRRRLYDLGVHEGSVVSMKQRGPFGGPVTLECNGQLLGIRLKEAREIEVSVC
ncbi:FeoA family protein [Paenibacillus sp.]|jgi:ferrous iron transport protein A|uniref:FeoA family protein n=1 Tax=Paenibacillus sp. TaxID=58172 RepID=UPI002830B0F9|nr:FeoA family protein [Paenibacillus sp.]MDR0268823.1 ferrous iron transport protein A [Paenibacillus sp.]